MPNAHADELAVLHREHVRDETLDGHAACSAGPAVAGDPNHVASGVDRLRQLHAEATPLARPMVDGLASPA
jgi:hypothetical protein